MQILLTIIHIFVCFLLVGAVLLQSGKGGGLASSLGGGLSSSSVLGGRSAVTFLSKATAILATIFMLSAVTQALLARAPAMAPTTATERVMRHGHVVPEPVPFQPAAEGGGMLPPAAESGAAQPGTQTQRPAAQPQQTPAPSAPQSGQTSP